MKKPFLHHQKSSPRTYTPCFSTVAYRAIRLIQSRMQVQWHVQMMLYISFFILTYIDKLNRFNLPVEGG